MYLKVLYLNRTKIIPEPGESVPMRDWDVVSERLWNPPSALDLSKIGLSNMSNKKNCLISALIHLFWAPVRLCDINVALTAFFFYFRVLLFKPHWQRVERSSGQRPLTCIFPYSYRKSVRRRQHSNTCPISSVGTRAKVMRMRRFLDLAPTGV